MFRRAPVLAALAILVVMTSWLALAAPVAAGGPDYAAPGDFRLPWADGQVYRVTWEPADHWANAKAHGLAYDFSMDIGTPLYAPTDGWIYYLFDERPFSTNYGHYVEIVSEDGDWLIRLAHLRDDQSGEGPISAGALIGHSGMSGATAAHLHLELFVRDGDDWVCPDQRRLARIYGYPAAAIREGASLTCYAVSPSVDVTASLHADSACAVGEPIALELGLLNQGASVLAVDRIQAVWVHEQGDSVLAEARGSWRVPSQGNMTLTLPVSFSRSGRWTCSAVTYLGEGVADQLAVDGAISVSSPPMTVVGLVPASGASRTQSPLHFAVGLANTSWRSIQYDGVELIGDRPDGTPWRILLDEPFGIAPRGSREIDVKAKLPAGQAGVWTIQDVAGLVNGERHYFDGVDFAFEVLGPELRVESLQMFDSTRSINLMLTLRNVGTEPLQPDRVEVWGWRPDGVSSFAASQSVRMSIQPGASARFLLSVPTLGEGGPWRVAGVGYWLDGDNVALPLPSEPILDVAPLALISLLK